MELNAFVTNVKALARLTRDWMLAVAIVPASLAGTALAVNVNQHGLTGTWYQPATAAQGIQLEVYPNAVAPGFGYLQGSWATFLEHLQSPWDYDGGQRWYTFGGTVLEGQTSATLVLYQNVGGNFNKPPATTAVPVGRVTLRFHDCANADMDYTFHDGTYCSSTIPLVRLTPNVTCSASAAGGSSEDFSFSGNWFDPETAGQGFAFELNPNAATVFFVWYTYVADGQAQGETWLRSYTGAANYINYYLAGWQAWYTAQANYTPSSRTLPMTLYETTLLLTNAWTECGSAAGQGAKTVAVGTATATFRNCLEATLAFNFTGGSNAGASGTINLSRAGPPPPGCGDLG